MPVADLDDFLLLLADYRQSGDQTPRIPTPGSQMPNFRWWELFCCPGIRRHPGARPCWPRKAEVRDGQTTQTAPRRTPDGRARRCNRRHGSLLPAAPVDSHCSNRIGARASAWMRSAARRPASCANLTWRFRALCHAWYASRKRSPVHRMTAIKNPDKKAVAEIASWVVASRQRKMLLTAKTKTSTTSQTSGHMSARITKTG